jgi:hypothetical protein
MYSWTLSLTSTLYGRGLSMPRPGRFTPGKDPVLIVLGGWVDPRAGLESCAKFRPPPGFYTRTVQSVASRYADWAVPAPRDSVHFEFIHRSGTVVSRNTLVLYNQHSELRTSKSLDGVTFQNTHGSNTPWYKVFTDQYLKGHITKKFLVMETLNLYSVNCYVNAWSVFVDSPNKEIHDFRNKRFIMFTEAWTNKLFIISFSRTPYPFAN